MTESPSLTVLNVGHGLCAVLRDERGTMLFDVAPGPVPRDYLRTIGVSKLDAVMISHFHKDHCSGATGFFGNDYRVTEVFMNSPRAEETETYEEITAVLDTSRKQLGRPLVRPFDTDTEYATLDRGRVQVRIVTPDAVDARSETALHNRRVTHTEHSLCGVVRVDFDGHARVLLAGDLNRRGLEAVLSRDPTVLDADILVYPHHGGEASEPDEREFAELLSAHVRPKLVVFSMGREKGERPHPEVMEGISTVSSGVVCTQLSKQCDDRDPGHAGRLEPLPMIHSVPAEKRNLCCGGSVMIPLEECGEPHFVGREEHMDFIDGSEIPRPMCRAM